MNNNEIAGDSYRETIDYCNYLNDVAQEDPHGIFEQELSLTMRGGSIFRLGSPGCYFYQAISQSVKGIFPIMSFNELSRFSCWRDEILRDSSTTSITEYKKCVMESNPINNAGREEIDFVLNGKIKNAVAVSFDHDLKSNIVHFDFYNDSGIFSQAGLIELTTAAEFVDQTLGLVISLLVSRAITPRKSFHADSMLEENYQPQRRMDHIDNLTGGEKTEMILSENRDPTHLARIIHIDRDEEAAKLDGARRIMKSDYGCMSACLPRKTLSSTEHSSGFPDSIVNQHKISGLEKENISNDSLVINPEINKAEFFIRRKSKSKAFQRLETALLFEDKQYFSRKDQNSKIIPFFSNVALLSEKEKKNLIQKLFFKLIWQEQKKHFEFRTFFLNTDPKELDPQIIRDQWNVRNQEPSNAQPISCDWDALLELIHDQINWELRDANTKNIILDWKKLSSNVLENKNFWKGNFWSEYWLIEVLSIKAKHHEIKDQSDFIELIKEINISLVPSLEVLKESFNGVIDSAEHLAHAWKVISDKQQAAFNNDQCLKEFSKEIFEAKQNLAYWNIEILHRKALLHEASAEYLFEKAVNNDPNQKNFPQNWIIARDAILDAHASYSFFKESILKRIMEMSDQGIPNNNLQPLYEWLEEIEYKITFWENEISWSKGEEAHLIAEAAIEIYLSEEDSSSFDSKDNFYITPDFLRYLNPVELNKIRGAIMFLSTAMDMQFRACSKVALKYQKSFQDKYDLALEQINHWNEWLQDYETLRFNN